VKRTALLSSLALILGAPWLAESCEEKSRQPAEPTATEPSPNASILPAPLASDVETQTHRPVPSDAGAPLDASVDAAVPTTRWLKEDEAVEADVPPHDSTGVRLLSRLRWLDLPPFPRMPESNAEALQKLKEALAFELTIELSSAGRLRARFDSDAFVLPRGSELRSRPDRLGHVLTWDEGSKYTVLPAGTLRAVLNEHRPDNAPLLKPKIAALGAGNAQSLPTEKAELTTPLGRLVLESASLPNAGNSGRLLCRLLAELITADPVNAACDRALVPLRAELFTRSGGHLLFEVFKIDRDRALDPLLVPPAEAHFVPGELPSAGSALVPSAERLRELRLRALPRSEKPEPQAPKQGLVVQNRSDVLRYVLLDGVV
jgi:hypothetical protein